MPRRLSLPLLGLLWLALVSGSGGCAVAQRAEDRSADSEAEAPDHASEESAIESARAAAEEAGWFGADTPEPVLTESTESSADEEPAAAIAEPVPGDPEGSIRVDAEPYVLDPRGERDGVPITSADGVATPIAGASRLVGPVAVFRVLGTDLVGLQSDERAALAASIEANDLLTPSVLGLRTTADMTERARSEGARSVAIVRFVGTGGERRARVILLDVTGRGIGVLQDLEPSLAVVAAAIRERL